MDWKMKKLFQLVVVVILFFLPFVEGGCSRASSTRAVNESSRDIVNSQLALSICILLL